MDQLFIPFKFKTNVQLSPVEIYGNINDRIREKLKKQYEGICSRFGFVQPNSIDVIRRSAGLLLKAHFNGHVKFEVYCKARVCNPVNGMILSGKVINKNQLGILADCKYDNISVLDVIIPYKTAGIQSEIDLGEYNVGQEIFFQVVGKRSQLNDKKISVIGRGVSKVKPIALAPEPDHDEIDGPEDESDVEEYFDDIDIDGGAEEPGTESKEVGVDGEGDMSEEEDDENVNKAMIVNQSDDENDASELDSSEESEEEDDEIEEELDDYDEVDGDGDLEDGYSSDE